MEYAITFIEGVITFVSPCVLPMIPLYILYFAGDGSESGTVRTLKNSIGFVVGFTLVFVVLGIFAGTAGRFLADHQSVVNVVSGIIVMFFGLHYTGVVRIGFLNRTLKLDSKIRPNSFWSSSVFGLIFAVGWSPCTGAFLGSAMLLAAGRQSWFVGMLLLLCYSLGLGLPFVLCAVLIDSLKGAFEFIKNHYRVINIMCGVFLIVIGFLMALGLFTQIYRMVL